MWPCSLAFGATWDTKLVHQAANTDSVLLVKQVAAAIGREYRGKGANIILGPSVQADFLRDFLGDF